MTMPKIDRVSRNTRCNLGLWNLNEKLKLGLGFKEFDFGNDVHEFALGQNFIRQYNMTLKYIKTSKFFSSGINDVSVMVYIGAAGHRNSMGSELYFMLLVCFLLLVYLGYFSVLKFRRVKKESSQFE